MKLTPVLYVDSVEKSLPFWVERMGFVKVVEVPEGEQIGFVILVGEGVEVMLQSIESAKKDVPQFISEQHTNRVTLYVEVGDFADVTQRLEGYAIAMPERTTFYETREIGVFEPGGHAVIFGAREEKAQ